LEDAIVEVRSRVFVRERGEHGAGGEKGGVRGSRLVRAGGELEGGSLTYRLVQSPCLYQIGSIERSFSRENRGQREDEEEKKKKRRREGAEVEKCF
jgi:hypothetical protein